MVEEEIDEDANDSVRLWEDGWKQRYYKIKFNVEEEDVEFRRKIVITIKLKLKKKTTFYLYFVCIKFESIRRITTQLDFNGCSSTTIKACLRGTGTFPIIMRLLHPTFST